MKKPIDILLCSGFLLGCLLIYSYGYYFSGQFGFAVGNDDSFISYRYSTNMIDYGILSFNKEDEKVVEGFSNPLHVLISSGIYAIGGKELVYPINAFLGALLTLLAIILAKDTNWEMQQGNYSVWMLALLAAAPSLWIHATSGLETASVFLAQIVFWRLVIKEQLALGSLIGLIFVTLVLVSIRTDGFIFPLLGATWLIIKGKIRAGIVIIGAAATFFFILMAARYAYFAEVMPNTYYAKVNGEILDRLVVAMRYLASIAVKNGLAIGIIAFMVVAVRYASNLLHGKNRTPSFELWAFGGIVAYYLYIGGDIYRERFLLILYPLGAVLVWRALSWFHWQRAFPIVAILIAIHQLSAFFTDPRLELQFERPKYDRFIALGTHLGENHPEALLATGAAGKIPYFSGLETIDMLGLNDLHIARVPALNANPGHGRFDTDYVLSRKPNLICDHVYGDGHMVYGLERPMYEAEGYVVKYLVKHRGMDGDPILDVSELAPEELSAVIESGYDFGCLFSGS